mgnify:CR=1 FL=1
MHEIPLNQSDILTHGIRVQTESYFIPERSAPMRGLYLFGYTINIINEGDSPAKLLSRHWHINDILGNSEEVQVSRSESKCFLQAEDGIRDFLL